jgi:3'-phosphoadenosine 5'-phosphosulfate sulfotransferase (PAPS reductase)/FAD synthetase
MVLDAGCGVGAVAEIMADLRPDLWFLLLNTSAAQLAMCPEGMGTLHASFDDVPLGDGGVDAVMFCYALGHGEVDRAIAEAARVLCSGGVLFLYELVPGEGGDRLAEALGYRPYRSAEIYRAAEAAGLHFSRSQRPAAVHVDHMAEIAPRRGVRRDIRRRAADALPVREAVMLAPDESAAVLQFSGGKDSTALLYLARPHLARIRVLYVDTGAAFPHVKRHVVETCERLGARLTIVHSHVREHIDAHGMPADVVPVEATAEMAPFLKAPAPVRLQSYLNCCAANLWLPMHEAVKASGARIVLRGSKLADARVGVPDRFMAGGIEYRSPLWDWSDADVMAYLAAEGATLPEHYSEIPDSLDCWLCTAHMAHHGRERLAWTREHYPDLWPEVAERMRQVAAAVGPAARMVMEAAQGDG